MLGYRPYASVEVVLLGPATGSVGVIIGQEGRSSDRSYFALGGRQRRLV